MTDEDTNPPARLRSNRDFVVMLGGQSVSELGDAVAVTVMPLLVLHLTGSGALMGLVGAMSLLPDLVFGLVAGAYADRWDRRRMMLVADIGRALLTAMIPISYWLSLPTMTVVLIVVIPISTLRVLWAAGFTSAVPALVGRDQIGRANSLFETFFSGGYIVGPALAGVLVATIGPAQTLALDACSFAVSALSLSLVRRRLRAEPTGETRTLRADITEGIRFAWRSTSLRMVIGLWSAVSVATAALIPALSFYLTVDRDHGAELFGFIGSVWSVGYLLGSLAAGKLVEQRVGERLLMSGIAIALGIAVIATASSPIAYLIAAFLIGVALAVMLVLYATLRTSLTPDHMLGRVGSTARTLSLGLQPLSLLAAGALIEASSAQVALYAMAGLAAAATLLFGSSGTLRRAMPATPPSP